jgi:putative transcriptional regulator
VTGVEKLAPGFLIAMPQLGDPNFHRAVVFVFQHGPEGARGLVLNRPSPVTLRDVARGQSLTVAPRLAPQKIYVGGPVEPQRGFVLHDRDTVDEKQPLSEGLFLSETVDALEALLSDAGGSLRFYLGYAGWGPGQLERELAAGAWLFTEAATPTVLGGQPETLWDDTLRSLGVDPAMLQPGGGMN